MHRTAVVLALVVAFAPAFASEPGQPPSQGTGGVASKRNPRIPIRVEGDVKPPELILRVQPQYPDAAKQARIFGNVLLQIIIDEKGAVEGVEVLRSNPTLDQAAMDAVRRWKYKPATLYGRPVAVFFTVVLEFELPQSVKPEGTTETEGWDSPGAHVTTTRGDGGNATGTRTMTIRVREACEPVELGGVTVEVFNPATGDRQAVGVTGDDGAVTVTFPENAECLLLCADWYECVVRFPRKIPGVESMRVRLPRSPID